MKSGSGAILVVTFVLVGTARADEAVTLQGQRLVGTLRKTDFLPAQSEKAISLAQIQAVTFPEQPPPLPRCRLLHQLLVSGGEQLAGELFAITQKEVRFRAGSGDTYTIPRRRLLGIVQ